MLEAIKKIGTLVHKKEWATAEADALKLLQDHPNRPDVHNILGIIYKQQNKRGPALKHLEFAAKAEPRNPIYLNNVGRFYLDSRAIELALPFLHNALLINPKQTETLLAIGEYYRQVGKAALALPYLERARGLSPDDNRVKMAIAESFDVVGRLDESNRLYEELRGDRRYLAMSLYRLAMNQPTELHGLVMSEAQKLLEGAEQDDKEASMLHTSLGFIHEKAGRYPLAFRHFEEANRLGKMDAGIEIFRKWVDSVIAAFTPETLRAHAHKGSPSEIPVLVVGMPRSGTTLTEQVIASHGQAAGAGELQRINQLARSLQFASGRPVDRLFATLETMPPPSLREFADNYVKLLEFHGPKALRVVDKMPHNFINLGVVAMLWPSARIVHCKRNPVDTCWSCFQNPLNDAHPYSRDLVSLGLYYREYSRLMDHWKQLMPHQIYELNYEKFTADFEAEARKMIDFLGLSWDEACLNFHESGSTVQTFSRRQVRNPVYKSSVERWRRYENELQPLVSALGDLVH
ncbi:tetratricopeptide repeat protein [Nordella sp. HKS 07]|uniref:tetratricopeptide repeat-containing sulfotransferase family protein n=1 Tax=Nordella sp. HKS 07 TaxID=2712222 RepID=UPI0013E114F1|nr:sulfotransferase [Nordella sp. HKS 07]QIG50089.1 tetratricopeptide repeat protein [Nordella sp. HKS 07]